MTDSLLFRATQLRSKNVPIIRQIISYVSRVHVCPRCSRVLSTFPVIPYYCRVCNFSLSDLLRFVIIALDHTDGIHPLDISLLQSIYHHYKHHSIYNRYTIDSFFD